MDPHNIGNRLTPLLLSHRYGYVTPIDNVTVTGRSMIKLMPMGDFFYDQFMFADKFNLLHLSDAELALLSAVMILNPGQ